MSRGTPHRKVRVPDELWGRALARAEEEGTDVSAVLRRALAEWVDRKKETQKMTTDLYVEKVTQNYQPHPGQMATRTFWITYPAHVAGYARMSDRISRATSQGRTRRDAIAAAGQR